MTKLTITRDRAQQIFLGNGPEPSASEERELARMALAAMDSEPVELPLDYLQGHKDGLEWAAQLAEANHPETGDWLYDDPIDLAKAIRKGPDMPPAQPVADSEPVIVVGDDGGDALSYRRLIQSFEPGTKLYRHAQPAPVVQCVPLGDSPYDVPYSMPSNLRELIAEEIGILFSDDDAQGVWIACRRAAMLATSPQSPGSEPATVPGKWIPVSERMPEDEQEVLTINKMGHRFVSFFDKHSGLFFDRLDAPVACCIEHVLVTHWMPLPAAPQEVKGE
ncbi:DUF551 domain-containing protein [Klebsiella pneumoniae]|uniref:DUF551 domain-containing protein n=1 Tax=Klebsiella pneumoniae TaxID=573 RepID=UPI0010DF637F|nr:DUF551 domain-containing protein [Klebsiella pneumoniae]UDD05856.1 DUF551 domain-containing protein [Klebsiella pneumoniae]VGO94266.1 hypothetical protein SB00612_00135 [Klebsiella pneumoniae]